MTGRPRRRILCVRPGSNKDSAAFLADLVREWIDALAIHADVTVMSEDFDFRDVCTVLLPDFVIFEAVDWARPWRLQVTNADSFPEIPRALLLNVDPHDPMRPLIFDALKGYGVDTVFQFSGTIHAQHMPELAHIQTFSVPQFIDGRIFHDYGLPKTIPVSIFSAHHVPAFYPWRAQVTQDIQHIFPTLLYTHPGYTSAQSSPFAVQKETYARLLNQSWFSLADTTRFDYVVRKHLEIPAAGAVLVAPISPALHDYGFRDLENCILDSGPALYKKIDAVSRHPGLYESIRAKGQALVQARYIRESWTHILDWYEGKRRLKPGQTLTQGASFGPFQAVATPPYTLNGEAPGNRQNEMTTILNAARQAIFTGRNRPAARADLIQASGWASHMAEPWFMLGIMALLDGEIIEGALLIARRATGQGQIDVRLAHFDPVEIAWLLLAAHLIGQEDLAQSMLAQAAGTSHISLRRTFWLLSAGGSEKAENDASLAERDVDDRLSIHWLGQETFETWCDLVCRIFQASGHGDRLPFKLKGETPEARPRLAMEADRIAEAVPALC